MIKFSISWDKFHFDIPIGPADKGDGHSNGLMVVLQSELLHHLDGEHVVHLQGEHVVHLQGEHVVHLQLSDPPSDAQLRIRGPKLKGMAARDAQCADQDIRATSPPA